MMTLFDTFETHHEGLEGIDKWPGCLSRHVVEQHHYGEGRIDSPVYIEWMVFFASLVGRSKADQLKRVNDWVNRRLTWVADLRSRGQRDHWQSPAESLEAATGDCEDYAILKVLTLWMLGWRDLRIVLVSTDQGAHAVCVAMLKGKWLVLDNLTTLIYEDRKLRRYKPTFSMDETGWWRHRKAPRAA